MAPRTKYKVTDVFVPGGLPKHTYVPRTDRLLEDQIASTKDNLSHLSGRFQNNNIWLSKG